jgi:DNA-directed RNA polymerase specialized sigma24 family protein
MDKSAWPSFLDRLDNDPDGAFEEFYKLASESLGSVPPRPMSSLNVDDRQDLFHDIVYHCVKDNFRILRRYVNRGRPFIAWLYVVAHHRCMDYIRSRGFRPDTASIHADSEGKGLEQVLPDPSGTGGRSLEHAEILDAVRKGMRQMGEYCRLLLEMAADEFTPGEMTLVLRLPADQNKKVSDDLRYCRKRLKKWLAHVGIEIA